MADTNSAALLGGILVIIFLIIACIVYFLLKKILPKHLVSSLILIVLGYVLGSFNPWNYIFYLAGIIFLILFLIALFKKNKTKIGTKK